MNIVLCIYIYIYTHIYITIFICICMYVCIYMYIICMYMYVYNIYIYIYIYIHTYVYIYNFIYILYIFGCCAIYVTCKNTRIVENRVYLSSRSRKIGYTRKWSWIYCTHLIFTFAEVMMEKSKTEQLKK